jgi:dTDP-glucose 4,6-dehydratase
VVSGGAGFIGSHLCEALIQDGWTVLAIDNLVTGNVGNVEQLAGRDDFELRQADVCEPVAVEGPVEAVFHFASPASPRDFAEIPLEILRVGTIATDNLLALAGEKRARFLLASTSEIYGDPAVHPQPETYRGNVNPVGPRGCYDEAKRCAEAFTMAYRRKWDVDTRIVRIFNTHGPRMRLNDGRVVPNFMTQALRGEPVTVYGDGSQTRSLCYVDDLVAGILAVFERGDGMPYNIGNPEEVTILELAKMVVRLTGSRSEIEFQPLPEDDPVQRQPDIRRSRADLEWEPEIGLERGLELTLGHFRSRV